MAFDHLVEAIGARALLDARSSTCRGKVIVLIAKVLEHQFLKQPIGRFACASRRTRQRLGQIGVEGLQITVLGCATHVWIPTKGGKP